MLNYLKTGSGNTSLVLIHGYCENNTCFNKQVLFFKDLYTVIAIDLPGFGLSQAKAEITMEEMALLVKEVLVQEGIHKCCMLGHSMGAYVTLAFAEQFPEMLSGFGLIHSTSYSDTQDRKEKRLQVVSFIDEYGKEKYIQNFIPALFAANTPKENIVNAIHEGMKSDAVGIKSAAIAMMNRPDRSNVLKQTYLPVFFGIGKYDTLIPEQTLFEQVALCKLAYIAYLQGSAHMSMVEEPELLNREIKNFLDLVKLNS